MLIEVFKKLIGARPVNADVKGQVLELAQLEKRGCNYKGNM